MFISVDSVILTRQKKLILWIMKKSLFLFIALFSIMSFGYTQNFSLNLGTVSLYKSFEKIKKESKVTLFYSDDELDVDKLVRVKFNNKSAIEMVSALVGSDYDVKLMDDSVILIVPAKKSKEVKTVVDLITVTGKVVDEAGVPLPGVNIKVEGDSKIAQTDINGKYTIDVPKDAKLQFSFVGFISKVVPVNNTKEINITLKQQQKELEGVTINTGVTVRKKELVTGAVAIYSGTELRQVSTQNAVQALKTIDPSFIVVSNNIAGSNPNRLPNIEVRGKTSLNINQVNAQFGQDPNQPLFILDGFPTTLQQVVDLDMNRILSITLLKDAASTALYGSRSANGVVVIETVKPTASKLQVTYVNNSSYEVADLSVYNLMNAEQKLEFERLSGAYKTPRSTDPPEDQFKLDKVYNDRLARVRRGVNTYWLNEPIQTGITSGHSLSLGGGSEEFRFNITGNYKLLSGTMKGSEHNTWGYNTNLVYRKNKLNISNNVFVNGGNNQESPYGSFSIWAKASPYFPKYNENGVVTPYLDGTSLPANSIIKNPVNPLYNVNLSSFDKGNNFNFVNNFALNYDLSTHIKTNAALSVSKTNTYTTVFVAPENTSFIEKTYTEKGSYKRGEAITNNWNANIGGTYSNVFNNVHSFTYTMRASAQETKNNSFSSVLRGFPTGVPANPSFAFGFEANSKPITFTGLNRSVDLTNQINYAYDRRFLLDLTHTISGSTNFGSNKKYSPYWGVGLGWNLNNEFKMNPNIVNVLKLRANIGQTGNQNLAGFSSYDIYTYESNTNIFGPGLGMSQMANANLESQKTKDLSLGIDLAMFRNRLTAVFGAFNRKTTPQIIAVDLASSTGVNSYPMNLGYIDTRGLELKLNYNIIYNLKENIIWGVGLTAASNENVLGGFGNTLASLNSSSQNTSTKTNVNLMRYYDGASSNDLWAVPSLGIDPATGREIFLKKDGQSTFIYDKNDEVVMGNSREIATGVIVTNVIYKGFSFGFNMRYSFGADGFNNALYNKVENIDSNSLFDNQDVRAFTDRWSTPGQVAKFKAISITESTPISSRFIQRDDYLSGESMYFGYKLTNGRWLKGAGLSSLGFNAIANDFFRVSTLKAERGIDFPFSRIYSLSINVSF